MTQSTHTGTVANIASEGQGIVRKDGFVTFVPFTATGDEIRYEVIQRKKNFSLGKLLDIIQPSSERTEPLCRYFGTCGGCQLQHIRYADQIEYKRKWIEDALRKIGKFHDLQVPPVMPANLQWHYRQRVNLILRKQGSVFQAGFIAIDHVSMLAVEHCPIFIEEEDAILKYLQDIVSKLKSKSDHDGKATVLKSQDGYIIHLHFRILPENAREVILEAIKQFPAIEGILVSSQKESFSEGRVETSCEIDGLSLVFNSKTFIQAHPEQSLNIYRAICKIVAEKQFKSVLDLYCGMGISTLLLAKQGIKVVGVELNPQSIQLAKANAKRNGFGHVKFLTADVERVLPELLRENPDLILVNPPREGLSPKVLQHLCDSNSPAILYISCMPSTLARDLKLLSENQYKVSFIQAFDMFPQTVHVETLVLMEKDLFRT